jgi:hypothetical protein
MVKKAKRAFFVFCWYKRKRKKETPLWRVILFLFSYHPKQDKGNGEGFVRDFKQKKNPYLLRGEIRIP